MPSCVSGRLLLVRCEAHECYFNGVALSGSDYEELLVRKIPTR
jgi:hypothetical protein